VNQESIPVWLAKESLRYFMAHSSLMPEPVGMLESELVKRAGVFVSLKRHGRLRGCIGTILPTQANVAREIIRNAVSAAKEDPRFSPVQTAELDELEVSVDILSTPERIESVEQLDPKHYGVIVRHGSRSGVLLPNLEGIETVADQIEIACQKADIGPDGPIDLYRFEVTRYH
jgi:AmmeMemoRadiSam system protein A